MASAVRQALRHVGVDAPAQAIGVQREPFEARGRRAEAFAFGARFARERLWHVDIAFERPIAGPLLIGDGRYLGLGLMAPVRRTDSILTLDIVAGLTDRAEPLALTRALRRAVMARAQIATGERAPLPVFFTGHAVDGAPSRPGRREHLAFAFDAPRKRLLIVAPHILDRREADRNEIGHLRTLDDVLDDLRELRAGASGKLAIVATAIDLSCDPLCAPSPMWQSLTPYRVTRHAKLGDAAAALEADLVTECRRAGLPRPRIEVIRTFTKAGVGLFGLATLRFDSPRRPVRCCWVVIATAGADYSWEPNKPDDFGASAMTDNQLEFLPSRAAR